MVGKMALLVAAFYKFFDFVNHREVQLPLKELMIDRDVKGSILLAPEGINGTISGSHAAIHEVLSYLRTLPGLETLEHKESSAESHPFARTKVRLKKEIITFGEPFNAALIEGTMVAPDEWNKIIEDPEVTILDSRNSYEVEFGTFAGAIDPKIRSFTQLKDFVKNNMTPEKNPRIATFCTGGIRCEKFAGWLKKEGYKVVYQLKGGILKYLEQVPEDQSRWNGGCFVFDERQTLEHVDYEKNTTS